MLSSQGQEALRAAVALKPIEENFLRDFTSLCRSYPPVLAKSALETAILRCEAGYKYPEAEGMYFTRPALEQASGYKIASYRAKRMAGFDFLIDLGCTIGSVTRALAADRPNNRN